MSNEFLIGTILLCISLVYFSFATWTLLFKPEWGKRIIRFSKAPWVPWTMKPEADPILRLSIFVGFFLNSALVCFLAYRWLRYFISR